MYVYYRTSFLCALWKGWKYVRQHWGMPQLCQLNVITKNAILPLCLYRKYHIPYLIVEHWSGYLPESGQYKGLIHTYISRLAAKYAQRILTVSSNLATQMQRCGLSNDHYRLVPNVVFDTFFHRREQQARQKKRILHVSFFTDAIKNESDIVRAVSLLYQQRHDFELVMVGAGDDLMKVKQLAQTLNLPEETIRWTGEIEPEQVAQWFAQSDFFVLYSNYETAGIVLAESLAAGIPIISTPVGIAPDIINDNTGLLVEKKNPKQLVQKMNWMLDHHQDFNPQLIKQTAVPFSMQQVGKYLKEIYSQLIITEK